jgi:hypothetical protein
VNQIEGHHHNLARQLGCVLCRRLFGLFTPTQEMHHVAHGSSKRSEFAIVPLCYEHHQGNGGLHGMGVPEFCKLYRVPWENEYGLLVWVNEDLAKFALRRLPMAAA